MAAASDPKLEKLHNHLNKVLKKSLISSVIKDRIVEIELKPDQFKAVMQKMWDDPLCDFKMLTDLTAVDYPTRDKRFVVVYHLLSLRLNHRIRIKVSLADDESLESITDIYDAALWYEREVFDMFGVIFDGNPDLRRILTDYGFDGHPLRKDFPLTGHVELRYDQEQKRVVYEPVKLNQDFRTFDFTSPWEGMTDVMLPGDEKAVKPENMPNRLQRAYEKVSKQDEKTKGATS